MRQLLCMAISLAVFRFEIMIKPYTHTQKPTVSANAPKKNTHTNLYKRIYDIVHINLFKSRFTILQVDGNCICN